MSVFTPVSTIFILMRLTAAQYLVLACRAGEGLCVHRENQILVINMQYVFIKTHPYVIFSKLGFLWVSHMHGTKKCVV